MPSIHLQLEEQLDTKTRELAQKLHLNRSAYIRKAVDEFNTRVERELLCGERSESDIRRDLDVPYVHPFRQVH